MHQVTPKVFMIAESKIAYSGMRDFLDEIGAPKFNVYEEGATDSERIVEIAGRLCYKSFDLELNKNLTRIREGNYEYLGNVLKQKHGSIFEHSYVTFACVNVSRIFTHELVRHRAGMAFSQESGRFVRIDDIGMYLPSCFYPEWIEANLAPHIKPSNAVDYANSLSENILQVVRESVNHAEESVKDLNKICSLNSDVIPFHIKKELTSAFRRIASGGMATNIIFTANHRALRHMISMRTALGAEEEIRQVFGDYTNDEEMREVWLTIAKIMRNFFFNAYQDMTIHNNGVVTFENEKV